MHGRIFIMGSMFFKTYSANAKDELEKNTEAMEELEKLGQDVK